MNSKDILENRKQRKDDLKKKKRRKKYEVTVRYVSSRQFEVMAYNEREAVQKAVGNLLLLEPPNTSTVSALVTYEHGSRVYDFHFNNKDLEEL